MKLSERIPIAVVGAGNMGRHHARNYDRLPAAELHAIVDADPARAREVASRYGVHAFSSVNEMLEGAPEVRAVSIATPTSLHFDVARAALETGKHVLVEKPVTTTADEAEQLIGLARQGSLVLAVGHVERFNPAVSELRRLIDSGELGEVLSVLARRVGVMPPQVKDANVIVDLAIHDIDIFRYLLGADEPEEMYCNAGKAIATDRFDFADIFLRFGTVACLLQANWLTPVKIRSLSVTGTNGYAQLEYVTQQLEYYRADAIRGVESFTELEAYSERQPEWLDFEHREPLEAELEEFLKAVRGEPAEIVTGDEGKRSIEIALRLTSAAEEILDSHSMAGQPLS